MLSILLASLAIANAHNWVNSPSRSENANPIKPSMPSETGQPHLQAIAGQKFQIEWVTGHDSYVYWVMLNAQDKQYLLKQNDKVLEDYINNAPADQQKPPTQEWSKKHRKYNEDSLDNKKGSGDGMFNKILKPGDAGFIERPDVFEGSLAGSPGTKSTKFNNDLVFIAEYTPGDCTDGDRRVMYKNPMYPYIIGVHRYKICAGQGSRPDVAHFAFPVGTKPGDYYVQYNWRGYYDIVDVQILPGTTALPKTYGDKPEPLPKGTPAEYRRIDHCVFPNATSNGGAEPINTCIRMRSMSSINGCKALCDYTTIIGCSGINVVPIFNPPTVYKGFKDVSFIPYDYPTVCSTNLAKGAKPTDRVCYPVLAREPKETSGKYIVSDDPEDPIFYSTCYVRIRRVVLANAPSMPEKAEEVVTEPDFLFQHDCIDCRTQQLSKLDFYTPEFSLQEKCMHCNLDGVPLEKLPNKPLNVSEPYPFKSYIEKKVCDNNVDPASPIRASFTCEKANQGCIKRLNYPGTSSRADVDLRDCVEMIKADPVCDQTRLFRHKKTDFWNLECNCWMKQPACCGPCVEKGDNSYEMWMI